MSNLKSARTFGFAFLIWQMPIDDGTTDGEGPCFPGRSKAAVVPRSYSFGSGQLPMFLKSGLPPAFNVIGQIRQVDGPRTLLAPLDPDDR